MSSKILLITSWRFLLTACSLVIVLPGAARAADVQLASNNVTPLTSPVTLRPLSSDETPLRDSDNSTSSAQQLADVGPIRPSSAASMISNDPGAIASAGPDPALPPATDSLPASTPPSASNPAANPQLAANNSARASDSAPAPSSPSQNATVNLINLMVKRNLITRDDADGLIRQAEQEADAAKAQAVATQAAAERALTAQQTPPAPAPAPAQGGDDEVRVTYVPDVVKKQITEQVTQNVLEQTRQEHEADTIAASQVPDWVKHFHVGGDIRVRYEDDQYPSGNAVGSFINFNAINTSASGINQNTLTPTLPLNNVDKDRERYRLRARIGAGIDLGQNFTAGLRVGTGSDNNPVSENQSFGQANNGQGGNFSKYAVWLDRAFIRYDWTETPNLDASVTVGRFDNPFFNTSMMWADDLAFDGVVVKGSYKVAPGVKPFLTAGAFPIFNTDLNFSTNQAAKFQSEDKYLFAVQGGSHLDITKDFSVTGAGGYYDFENIQGKVSDPIFNAGLSSGDTDDSRPAFAQNGNTYIALRDYEDPTSVPGVTVENQYYGLATPFHIVALTGQIDYNHLEPFHMSLTGEFIKNVAFDRNAIVNGGPTSNPGPQNNTLSTAADSFDGGDSGYLVHFDVGKVALEHLWDWNVRLCYRYVETDAMVDGFVDSDFGGPLSGTNLKGYTVGGNLAFSSHFWAGLRYMSADNISGPTYHNDLIQFDLNAKF